MKAKVIRRDGTEVDDDDPHRIVRDGERVRIPMKFADAAANVEHKWGPPLSDDEVTLRCDLIDQRDKLLSDAWRNPPSLAIETKTPPASRNVEEAYAKRNAALSNAWRTPCQ